MLKNYFKVAVRSLLKNKIYSFINILGLSIGLAGFCLIYTYVSFELSYDKFHQDSNLIYRVTTDQVVENVVTTRDAMSFAPEGYAIYDELPEVVAFTTTQKQFGNFVMRIGDQLFSETMVVAADTNFLEMFNYPVVAGDTENPLKDPYSIVLTRSLAEKFFPEEDPIGKSIHVYSDHDRSFQVTAMLEDTPGNTHYKFDMLISLESIKNRIDNDVWNGFNYYTYVRVIEGTDIGQLKAKMHELSRKYLSPESTLTFNPQRLESIHLHSNFTYEPEVHGSIRTVYFLSIISFFIIVIAWVNYVNLSTAKAMDRAKEVGMRKVVGARKVQLIKQFFIESLLINLVSTIVALTIIQLATPLFNNLIGKVIINSVWLNTGLLSSMAVLFIVGTILSGAYPAVVLSSFRPVEVLKGKLRNSIGGIALRKGLVVFQFCTSLALIAGTLIVYLQLEYMRNQDLGVDIEQVLSITEPFIFGDGPEGYNQRIENFQNRVRQLSAVTHVGSTSSVPGGGSSDISSFSAGLRLDGEAGTDQATTYATWMDERYMDAVGLKLLAGRNFMRELATDSAAAMINETVMRRLGFTNPEDAINHYFQIGTREDATRWNIIGVVNNFNRQTLKSDYEPTVFFYDNTRTAGYQVIKLSGSDIRNTMAEIENVWFGLFPNAPFDYIFLNDKFDIAYREDRRFGSVFSVFAVLAVIIACLGLFGLSSFIAVQKTKEIGVRKVLGASVPSIVYLLSRDFLRLIAIGLAVGIPVVYFSMDQWLDNYAFRIGFPWWVFVIAGMALVIITLLTVSYQTLKAALINPSKSLRYE